MFSKNTFFFRDVDRGKIRRLGAFHPQLKVLNVMFNQLTTFFRFLLPKRKSLLSYTLQRVEVVQLNAVQFANVRIDVARRRQIDHKEWSVPAARQERRKLIQGDNRSRSCR
jgi:hypothetical protein